MKLRSRLLIAVAGVVLAAPAAFADHHGGMGKGPGHGRHMGRHMEMMDTNNDGTITREEAQAARKFRIMKADANGDGAVTLDEMKAFHEKMREKRREARMDRHFKRMDANGDGKITADEVDAMKMRRFDKIDANGDGKITKEEREAAHAKWKEHRHRMHKRHGGGDKDGQKDGQ